VIPRVYLRPEEQTDAQASLDPEQSAYLAQALRLKPGAAIQVFDGFGQRRNATLLKADRKACRIELGQSCAGLAHSPIEITLVQGLAQGDRMDWVVEKAVETGVARIIPVQASKSQVRLSSERASKRTKHWRRIAIAACRQSGRDHLPIIDCVQPLEAAISSLKPADAGNAHIRRFVLHPESEQSLSESVRKPGVKPSAAHLLVGPESGLSALELDLAIAAQWLPVSLGPRVLRTETAGLVGITVLQAAWGDLSGCAKP